ncbi:hypothetical protein [Mesoplasma photuris]|uniref:hypothetical protein n=1 Tax=Mesoplasma photuris TaxID=217731 RepID=UPI000ADB8ECC|nr:hypothetical protein [Mesoplasma photuris]
MSLTFIGLTNQKEIEPRSNSPDIVLLLNNRTKTIVTIIVVGPKVIVLNIDEIEIILILKLSSLTKRVESPKAFNDWLEFIEDITIGIIEIKK